ncbi:MAG: OmpA family protein [Deltaproteobacteria bacterium]|nr:OmpA family protein [Deltaproteobacteria bacterium]
MNPNSRYGISRDPLPVSNNDWAIVYAGFIIMLLCFFILLCAYSVKDRSKLVRAARSFSMAVGIFSGGQRFESGEVALPVAPDMVNIDSELAGIYSNVQEMTSELGMENGVKVSVSEKGLILQLSDRILFAAGQADILPEARKLIEHVGTIVANHPSYSLRIEGHTDNAPIRTSRYPSNWELSTSRAVNVVRYLLDKRIIAAERLLAAGFGEYKPLFPNDTPENRARNRRVELLFFRNEIKKVVQ